MEPEFFIEIKDYPNYYISTYGRVFSYKKLGGRGILSDKFRELKYQIDKKGYKAIVISNNGIQKRFRINRLVALHFVKNPNPKIKDCVDHININKIDNRVENLRWVTNQENQWNKNCKGYREEKGAFRAKIRVNGKYKSKSFSINKYGYEKAKQNAIDWRKDMKQKYYIIT